MAIWGLVGTKGSYYRDNVVQNGNNAVASEQAKAGAGGLEFSQGRRHFALAYDDLNKASGTLNQLGASFFSV